MKETEINELREAWGKSIDMDEETFLVWYHQLNQEQRELIAICDKKFKHYIDLNYKSIIPKNIFSGK